MGARGIVVGAFETTPTRPNAASAAIRGSVSRMSDHHRWLHEELPKLVAEGVIGEPQADALRTRYALRDEKSKLASILPAVGMALVGLGVLVVFGERWEQFSRNTRTLLAFGPTLLGVAYDRWVETRGPKGASAYREASSAAMLFGAAATCTLLRSTWDIHARDEDVFHVAAALTIAVAWWRQSTGPLAAFPFFVALASVDDGTKPNAMTTIVGVFLLAGATPLLRSGRRGAIAWRWLVSSFGATSFFFALKACLDVDMTPLVALASWIVGAHALSQGFLEEPGEARRVLGHYVRIAAVPLLLMLGFRDAWTSSGNLLGEARGAVLEASVFVAMAAVPWALAGAAVLRRERVDAPIVALGVLALTGIFGVRYGMPSYVFQLGAIALTIAWGLERVRTGVVSGRLGELNFGLVLVLGLVLVQVAGTSLSAVAKGLLFIAAGVAFLLVNRSVLARHRP
jgi:hypothetical protein